MDLAHSTVAVTGATGFLGRYLVDVLQDRGARVVAVVRNPDRAPELRDRGVELRRADLAEPDALAEGFRGADAIVSNAALFALSYRNSAEYRETNLAGTRNVMDAAARAGVGQVVQVSTSVVYKTGGGAHDEDHPLRSPSEDRVWPWTAYAISKTAAELEAWQQADKHGIALSSVRPGGIYGAFDNNFTKVHKALMRPPLSIYAAFFRNPVVYAGDVADAIARILERDVARGRAYNLAGDGRRTAWDFLRAWRQAGGRVPKLVIPIPIPVRQHLSIERAETELEWRNQPMLDALRETLAAEAAGPASRRIEPVSAT